MRKASERLGSYRPVSMALTVWRETSNRAASSACDQLCAVRNSRSFVFAGTYMYRRRAKFRPNR